MLTHSLVFLYWCLTLPLSHHQWHEARGNNPGCLDCMWSARDLPLFFFFFVVIKSGPCCPGSDCSWSLLYLKQPEIKRAWEAWGRARATTVCNPFLSMWFCLPLCELGALQASLGWGLERLVFSKLAYGLANWFSEGLKNKNCKSDMRSELVLCLSALGCLWEASNAFISKTLGNKTV